MLVDEGAQEAMALPKRPKRVARLEEVQKRLDKTFAEDKQRILTTLDQSNGCDKSPKGFVDQKCIPLMNLLNSHPDYVTTSSCSGRISFFHTMGALSNQSHDKVKRGDELARGWVYVTHDKLSDSEMSLCVESLASDINDSGVEERIEGATQAHVGLSPSFQPPACGVLSLKCEPFVMHVQCRTMESAKSLLTAAASDSGFRNSGVTPPGARIMVAIRHAGLSLDVPITIGSTNVVRSSPEGRQYLLELLSICNEKLDENDRRLALLLSNVKRRIFPEQH